MLYCVPPVVCVGVFQIWMWSSQRRPCQWLHTSTKVKYQVSSSTLIGPFKPSQEWLSLDGPSQLDLCVAAVGVDLLTSISGKPKRKAFFETFYDQWLSHTILYTLFYTPCMQNRIWSLIGMGNLCLNLSPLTCTLLHLYVLSSRMVYNI